MHGRTEIQLMVSLAPAKAKTKLYPSRIDPSLLVQSDQNSIFIFSTGLLRELRHLHIVEVLEASAMSIGFIR